MTKENALKKIYSKNYLIFLAIELIPLMWKALEIGILSTFENGLKIIGQVALVLIIFKIFQETIINPLYKILGKNKRTLSDINVHKMLLWISVSSILFTIGIFFLINPILKLSQVPDYILDETSIFMKIYVFSCGLGVIVNFLYTNSVIKKNTKQMLIYLLLKSVLTAIMFVILVPKFCVGLGANGIAITELSINALALVYLLAMSFKLKSTQYEKVNKKEYFKLLLFSFLETAIRNVMYYIVVLVFFNIIDNQELYFVSNEYIWAIMLVPCLAQNSLIKQALSNDEDANMKPYFLHTLIILGYMIVMSALSIIVYKYIYNLADYMNYFLTTIALLPCYITFIFDAVAESYFIATGRLHHVLIQTAITNLLIYLPALILYLCGIWTVTLWSIIILFSVGVIVSSAYTIVTYIVTKQKLNKQK